jgi:hypothetical protein
MVVAMARRSAPRDRLEFSHALWARIHGTGAVIRVEGIHRQAEWQSGLRDMVTQMMLEILQRSQVTRGFSVRNWVVKLPSCRL